VHEKTAECLNALTTYRSVSADIARCERAVKCVLDAIQADRLATRLTAAQGMPDRAESVLSSERLPTPAEIGGLFRRLHHEKMVARRAWMAAPADERTALDFPLTWQR